MKTVAVRNNARSITGSLLALYIAVVKLTTLQVI